MGFVIADFMTSSARCEGQESNKGLGSLAWFTSPTTVTASEEDIVSDLLSMTFSRLTFNKMLGLTGRHTPELKLVQRTKAFERHSNSTNFRDTRG